MQQSLFTAFFLHLCVCLLQATGLIAGMGSRAADTLLVVLASAVTLGWLLSQLPLQNVLAASGFLALLFAAAQGIRGIVMLQPASFTPDAGLQLFGSVPLLLLPVWLIALFNSRGTVSLLLARWRHKRNYGFLLIGLSAVLFVLFELALEAYASGLRSYWTWERAGTPGGKWGAPASHYAFWLVFALAAQVVVVPWLINKKPEEPRPAASPAIVWGALLGYMGVGAAMAGFWATAIVSWITAAALALVLPASRVPRGTS